MPGAWAVIPARGGSKGIPNKNLRTVGGVPLVVRTIRAALSSKSFAEVFVSTDDSEIASVARAAGAEVIERPPQISGDTASSESALLHALEWAEKRGMGRPDVLAMLQCTSPFTRAEDIAGLLETMSTNNADSAFTAFQSHFFLWKRQLNAVGINHDSSRRPRRQEREPEFVETGAIYAMKVAGFSIARHRFFGRIVAYLQPRARSLEVDEPEDLLIAEALARTLDTPTHQ